METSIVEPLLTIPFRVHKNRKETDDTRTLELMSMKGADVPTWRPGQFMMLYMFGIGEIPISICGDPKRRDSITHTVRAVGDVSRAICEAKPGSAIGVRGPFGSAWPLDQCEGHDILVVAGGIGLAPLRPILYRIMTNRSKYGRVTLLAGSRSPDVLLYQREMRRWEKADVDIRLSVDTAAPGWTGVVGPVTTLIPQIELNVARSTAFIVGPEIMMRFVVQAFVQRGVSRERLFVSMERNMKCAVGFCGHCQLGPAFICKDGPVFPYSRLEPWLAIRNL